MVKTQRGALYWLLYWTVMSASSLWFKLPHDLLILLRVTPVLLVPYVYVGRVLYKLREFERDGRVPGEVEGFLFETACAFPMMWGLGVTLLSGMMRFPNG
jgi:hypothetical protein